jgi:hypothetical protein
MRPEQTPGDWTNLVGSRRICANGSTRPKLNCISEVIERERLSPRTLANRLNLTVTEVLAQADPSSDLTLSNLYRWQAALQVPMIELLVEIDSSLSPAVERRCQLLKAMRTVRSIQEQAQQETVQRMALQLVEQILDMMPELKEVSAWPSVGQRRTKDELGVVVDRCVPESMFHTPPPTEA